MMLNFVSTVIYEYLGLSRTTYKFIGSSQTRLPLSTTVYHHLQPSTAVYNRLQPSTAIYDHSLPSTSIYNRLRPSTSIYNRLPSTVHKQPRTRHTRPISSPSRQPSYLSTTSSTATFHRFLTSTQLYTSYFVLLACKVTISEISYETVCMQKPKWTNLLLVLHISRPSIQIFLNRQDELEQVWIQK